jgi:hypothetical protein
LTAFCKSSSSRVGYRSNIVFIEHHNSTIYFFLKRKNTGNILNLALAFASNSYRLKDGISVKLTALLQAGGKI